MRRKLVAGNWKMNGTRGSSITLAREIVKGAAEAGQVDIAVCPPAVYLDAVHQELVGTPIVLGAQNMYFELQGAYTGEISPAMLIDLGCRYVILGHSERRQFQGETDELVFRKTVAALNAAIQGQELTPIVCLGESLAQREAGQTMDVIARQFAGSLGGLSVDQISRVVIAYEPVWAIGTGKVAGPTEAQQVHGHLRNLLADRYNAQAAGGVRILYGGSVKPDNAGKLMREPDVDGALVGGASLKAADFLGIVRAARSEA
jgi:triosephosphate isomerase